MDRQGRRWQPSPKLLNGWRAILGDSDGDTYLDQVDNCPLVANPSQGAQCPQGTVGGTVPATLALTMGAPVTFGAFIPGIDRTYEASTTATITSTAGDATLSVADPAGTGLLVNGAFSLSEPLTPLGTLATYAGPMSNAVTTVTFRQHISATQALRTGAYAKTLTFTLSTTTP